MSYCVSLRCRFITSNITQITSIAQHYIPFTLHICVNYAVINRIRYYVIFSFNFVFISISCSFLRKRETIFEIRLRIDALKPHNIAGFADKNIRRMVRDAARSRGYYSDGYDPFVRVRAHVRASERRDATSSSFVWSHSVKLAKTTLLFFARRKKGELER